MSEHELSTMLRDHLSDEPPVGVRSHDAIRTARRGTNRRLAITGVAAVVALGLAAGFLPGLLADDGPSKARETTGFSGPTDSTYADRVQAVAQDELGPYVDLGTADLWVVNVDIEDVPADSPDVQTVGATYDHGDSVVRVGASGFAPEEFGSFQLECNPAGWDASCEPSTLPDGSTIVTEVARYAQEFGSMRSVGPTEAAKHPDTVFWGRSVHVATPSGLDVYVAEYIKTPNLEDVQWQIPADALMGAATDAMVLDPTGLAHAPVCSSAHASC